MTSESDRRPAGNLFGNINEADRKAALDAFGEFLMKTRDAAIRHWDQLLSGGKYPPWERLLHRYPDLDERSLEIVRETLPHIVDTVLYRFLADLDASRKVRISVVLEDREFADIARLSWGLAAEPVGDEGWLARFSKERFEQPY